MLDRDHCLTFAIKSHHDREPILPPVLLGKARDELVVGDDGTSKLDRRSDEQPICGVALFEMTELIAARGGPMLQRHSLDSRTIEEALDPCRNGKVEVNSTGIDK